MKQWRPFHSNRHRRRPSCDQQKAKQCASTQRQNGTPIHNNIGGIRCVLFSFLRFSRTFSPIMVGALLLSNMYHTFWSGSFSSYSSPSFSSWYPPQSPRSLTLRATSQNTVEKEVEAQLGEQKMAFHQNNAEDDRSSSLLFASSGAASSSASDLVATVASRNGGEKEVSNDDRHQASTSTAKSQSSFSAATSRAMAAPTTTAKTHQINLELETATLKQQGWHSNTIKDRISWAWKTAESSSFSWTLSVFTKIIQKVTNWIRGAKGQKEVPRNGMVHQQQILHQRFPLLDTRTTSSNNNGTSTNSTRPTTKYVSI